MAIKFINILVLVGMISTLLVLSSCTQPLECPPCRDCEVCPDFNIPDEEVYEELGCVPIDEVNGIIVTTNDLVEYINKYDDVPEGTEKLVPLQYYVNKKEVGE